MSKYEAINTWDKDRQHYTTKEEIIIVELEELKLQIIEKRQLIKRDTVIFTDRILDKINAYTDILCLVEKRIAELKED